METSIDAMDEEAREYFLDLGSFPKDRKILMHAFIEYLGLCAEDGVER